MKSLTSIIFVSLVCFSLSYGQILKGGGEGNPQLLTNQETLRNWQDLRFGMFIHWGPVSIKGTEIGWSRGREVPFKEYDALYKQFNPTKFDAKAWVSLIKEAGMKYLVVVTKHHDGFVMWDSETTEYDIASTPYQKDPILALSKECEAQGILFGTYYSICDWHHPDYPLELHREGKKENADMGKYIAYMKAQIKELVEKYNTKLLWFDGEWEEPWTHEMGMDLYKYVRSLDNEILINNRVDKGREGMEGTTSSEKFAGDYATPEQQIGRFDLTTPWESCITICEQWAWKPNDKLKSKEECIQTIVRAAGGGGNLLLNIGPKPDGSIERRQVERLEEIGEWMLIYGETIYKTKGGPMAPKKWGAFTQTESQVYIHIFETQDRILLREFPVIPESIFTFEGNKEVSFKTKGSTLRLYIPKSEFTGSYMVLKMKKKE